MVEIRFHGRFGQPVGKLVRSLGQEALKRGKHVQIFDAFAAFRPGAPMYSVIRIADGFIRQRSANNTKPDMVIVLDNSLFQAGDVLKGLPGGAAVMALGAESSVLGDRSAEFKFIPLDPFFPKGNPDPEKGLLRALENQGVL